MAHITHLLILIWAYTTTYGLHKLATTSRRIDSRCQSTLDCYFKLFRSSNFSRLCI